jgi:hypothetical protein
MRIVANNPLQATAAQAILDERKAVAIRIQQDEVAVAKANAAAAYTLIHSFFGEGITTRQMAEAYVSIKAPKWYGEFTLAQPLADLKSALYIALKAENVSLEANALKEWFANN